MILNLRIIYKTFVSFDNNTCIHYAINDHGLRYLATEPNFLFRFYIVRYLPSKKLQLQLLKIIDLEVTAVCKYTSP